MKKTVISLITAGFVVVAIGTMVKLPTPETPARASEPAASPSKPLPQPIMEMATPKRFAATSVEVNASIEGVGVTAEGDMDVPKDETTLGWYGAIPGQPGRAVLAGHTGYPEKPSIFRRFERLKIGDVVEIEDEKAARAMFRIIEIAVYTPDKAPREMIFGPSATARLALITCTGEWRPALKTYSHRLVIFAVRQE